MTVLNNSPAEKRIAGFGKAKETIAQPGFEQGQHSTGYKTEVDSYLKAKLKFCTSLSFRFGLVGGLIGIWGPLFYFFIARSSAGKPLSDEFVDAVQQTSNWLGLALAIAFFAITFLLLSWVVDREYLQEKGLVA